MGFNLVEGMDKSETHLKHPATSAFSLLRFFEPYVYQDSQGMASTCTFIP